MSALLLVACKSPGVSPERSTPLHDGSASSSSSPTLRRPPKSMPCEPLPPLLPSYDAIEQGHRFSLTIMQDDNGTWMPSERLPMPYHHASSIEWQGTDSLESFRGQRVLVAATGLGRVSIRHESRPENVWYATYAARIEAVCSASPRN